MAEICKKCRVEPNIFETDLPEHPETTRSDADKICICRMCPSYFSCGEMLAFCVPEAGKSKCIRVERGCVCPGCPVQQRLHYQHVYYCTRGSEKEITAQYQEV